MSLFVLQHCITLFFYATVVQVTFPQLVAVKQKFSKMPAVWNYFKVENENSTTAICTVCSASILYAGSSEVPDRGAFNTTNMIKHLKRKHLKEYSMLTQVTEENTSSKQQTGIFSSGKRSFLETATRQEKLQRG